MADYGSSYADKRQKIVELRIQRVYKEAQKDLQKKAEEYLKKHEKRDIQMRAALKAGKITKENYQNWQMGQVFIGKQWESKVNHATEVMLHSNERALGMIRGEQYNVYSENANYQAFQIERDTRGGISFDIYDEDTVRRLITERPELLPPKMINGKRDRAWNQGIIANSITQGIIQGESIPQIAKRMASDTGYHNMKAMTRYARTAMTAAQNAGRIDTMHRAQGMGLKIKKVWIAAHDSRVRDAHADLDGESVEVDEPFVNSLGEIDYPGDPEADGANVWNCRCSLGYEYPDEEEVEEIKEEQEEDPEVDDEEYEDMDYEEWKEMKEEEAGEDEEEVEEEEDDSFAGELLDADLSPNPRDYSNYEEFVKACTEYGGERTDYLEDVYANSDNRFRSSSRAYDEPFCPAAPIDYTIARLQERYPLIDNDRLIICDLKDAWQFLPDGMNDRRLRWQEGDGGAVFAQVFKNEGQTVIGFDRAYMNGSFRESLKERDRLISEGKTLPNVFPIESPQSISIHEWGHTVHNYYTHALCYGDEDAKGLWEWYQTLSKDDIRNGVSDYATENMGEFCAECFAEMQTKNPRPMAEKYWSYMKPLLEKREKYARGF